MVIFHGELLNNQMVIPNILDSIKPIINKLIYLSSSDIQYTILSLRCLLMPLSNKNQMRSIFK